MPKRLTCRRTAPDGGPSRSNQLATIGVNVHFAQPCIGHDDRMNGQRVEQLVGEDDAPNPVGQLGAGAVQLRGVVPKRCGLRGASGWTRLDEGEANSLVEVRIRGRDLVENVPGEAPAPGPGFHKGEGATRCQIPRNGQLPHFGELQRQ